MPLQELKIRNFDDFIGKMNGKVFHATTLENYSSILLQERLIANKDGLRSSIYGNSNGYFRQRNCVSFFDYRFLRDDKVLGHLYKCNPLEIVKRKDNMVVLVLDSDVFTDLQSWELWEEEKAYDKKVVPRIEVGYPDFVPLDKISETYVVSLKG